jgi:hypothetical protein
VTLNTCICPPGGWDADCPFTPRVVRAVDRVLKAVATDEIPNEVDGALRRSPSASLGITSPHRKES